MTNLIEELNEAITASNHTPQDIEWLGLSYGTYEIEHIILEPTKGLIALDRVEELYKDIEYNDSYGTQHLEGLVIFNDASWLQRGEYDGSEWWEYLSTPKFKDYLDN